MQAADHLTSFIDPVIQLLSDHCVRCGFIGDVVPLKWWQKRLPESRRYYCAGCGKTYLRLFGRPARQLASAATGQNAEAGQEERPVAGAAQDKELTYTG